jgi:DNA-directed RNA polymerase specialized sigma24 family protein
MNLKYPATQNQHATRKEKNGHKWSLTADAFDKLLFCLDSTDRESASEKYLLLRRNLVRFFEGRGLSSAEEAADEVCNRLARKLDAGECIENINQYAYGIARMMMLEIRKRQGHRCLNDLSAENRELILAYYQGDGRAKIENRQKLADKLGIPQNALRSRAVRLRERLKILISRNLKKQTI